MLMCDKEVPRRCYAAQNSLSLSVPPTRYRQLRTVAYLCAMAENASDETILSAVSTALEVTPSVAATLLMEYHKAIYFSEELAPPMQVVILLRK